MDYSADVRSLDTIKASHAVCSTADTPYSFSPAMGDSRLKDPPTYTSQELRPQISAPALSSISLKLSQKG